MSPLKGALTFHFRQNRFRQIHIHILYHILIYNCRIVYTHTHTHTYKIWVLMHAICNYILIQL